MTGRVWRLAGPAAVLCALAAPLRADAPGPWFAAPRGALIPGLSEPKAAAPGASLFAGRAQGGFFAPLPEELPQPFAIPGAGGGLVARIRHLIGEAEAGRAGYDAVQYGARIKPPKPPTKMTLAEVFAWIKATPGQPHAIGRYQFIPATLRRLVAVAGVPANARFDPALQDRLADILLAEAGLADARTGRMPRRAFMNNLAKIWAGLPTSSGRSHYHGYAGNRATITWAQFEAAMSPLFPG